MTKKTKISAIAVIVGLALIVGVGLVYKEKIENMGQTVTVLKEPITTSENFIEPKSELVTDWSTYTSNEYRYSIKYPENWHYKDYKGLTDSMLLSYVAFSDKMLPSEQGKLKSYQAIVIMVENRPFEEARSLFQYEPMTSPYSETEITVGGVKALKQSGIVTSDIVGQVQETRVLIFQNNKVYTLIVVGINLPTLDQMLSTFKFID